MHLLVLCLFAFQVDASDWSHRTIRVDLDTNRTVSDRLNGFFEQSERSPNGVNVTNGQYPWSILTTAWSGSRGIGCTSSIISENFALTDLHCTGRILIPPASVIEAYVGDVQWVSPLPLGKFVRHFWYIESSLENSPNIVLLRFHEPLTFNPNIQPIRLPSLVNFSYDTWASYMLGFDAPLGILSSQLQSVNANIRKSNACNFYDNFADHEICAIEAGIGYDSDFAVRRFNLFTGGAWLVYEYTRGFEFIPVLVGIHQYQYANRTATFGRATRVSHFVAWVEELTASV